jgi:hypothetical protein
VFGTAEGASGLTAAAVVDEWESQSQADPTGFHVNVLEIGGTAQTANDNGADINAILVDTAEIGVAGAGLTAADDAVMTRLGAPAGASVSADIAEIESQTDDIGVAGAGLTAADDAIVALIGTPSDFGSGTSTVAGNLQDLADNGTAVFDRSTDSLQAIRDRGDAAWTGAGGGDVTTIESTDATDYFDALVAGLALEATSQSILTDTAVIGVAGAGLSDVPWNAAWDAEVESEANDALVAMHLDHLFAADYDPATPPGTATALLNELIESDAGVSRFTANALENAPSGTGASAETIADEVETRTIAGVTTVGSVTGSVGSVTGAVGSVAGNVDGNVTGSVGSVATGGITAASVATDAIGADELAASAVTEIQVGLALEATLGTPADTDLATDIANAHASVLANRTQIFIGTADSGDTNTLVDSALGAAFANDVDIDGAYVVRGDGQRCLIDSFTQATDTIEFAACAFTGAWATQDYKIYPAGTQ